MLAGDSDTGSVLIKFDVTEDGLTNSNNNRSGSSLLDFGCFKLSGGLAFANAGGVADPSVFPAKQVADFAAILTGSSYSNAYNSVPDTSLGRAFYLAANNYSSSANDLKAFSTSTYLQTLDLPLDMTKIEGTSYNSIVDLIRWGQDGLAALTSSGHLYLLRGGAIVPGLLTTGTPARLLSQSISTVKKGSGSVLLRMGGSNFQPGVAVTWNGSYRTTTILDAAHVSVAIPASDLATAGSAKVVATNPGAAASNALTVTVQ
jgi:hypothetical protein